MMWALALRALALVHKVGPALLSLVWRLKWQIAVVLLALAVWHFVGLADRRGAALAEQAASYKAAQAEAATLAREAVTHRESEWRMAAQVEYSKHEAELATARSATARYIDAHRLRPEGAQGGGGTAAAAAQADAAGVRQDVPADGVVVSEQDVQACGEVTAYALALREWAISISEDSPDQQ